MVGQTSGLLNSLLPCCLTTWLETHCWFSQAKAHLHDPIALILATNEMGKYVKLSNALTNKRSNGPVNAHLRSAAYTNKHVGISWYLTTVQGQMKPLGHFLFSE